MYHATTAGDAVAYIERNNGLESLAVAVVKAGNSDVGLGVDVVAAIRKVSRQPFVAVHSQTAVDTPAFRQELTDQRGCNMVTADCDVLARVLAEVMFVRAPAQRGDCHCPVCGLARINASAMWVHFNVEHPNEGDLPRAACPICWATKRDRPLAVHIHNDHVPAGRQGEPNLPPPALNSFALAVVRNPATGKYLLVQEFAKSGYWLPGGRIDGSEDPCVAARRECLEEAGVDIELKGMLRVEFRPGDRWCKLRFIFYAEPKDPHRCAPKTWPDYESVGAAWVSASDLYTITGGDEIKPLLKLRSVEPLEWIPYLEEGGAIHPLSSIHIGNC